MKYVAGRGERCGLCGLVEVGGEVDEIGDGNGVVVVDVAVGVGRGGLVEVGGEGDEVGDRYRAIVI